MSRSNDPGAPAEAPENRANLEQVRVVPFVAGHLSAVERFSERVWSRPRTQAFLEWRYLASLPFSSSFVALAEATCVGVVAGLQKTHVIGGQSVPCLEVFDWHALPEAQGSGVGVRLMKAMMRLGVRLLSVGGSDDAVNAFPLLGWEPLGHAKEFVLPLSGGYLESRLNSKLGVRLPGQEAALSAVAATWFRPRPKRLLGWVLEATTLDPAIADLYTGDTGYDWLQRPTLAVPRWLSQSTWTGAYRCWLFGTGEGEPARGWVLGRVYDTVDGREASILDVYARDADADLYAWMVSEAAARLATAAPQVIHARATCPLLQAAFRANRFRQSATAAVHTWPRLPSGIDRLHITLNHADAPMRPYREAGASDVSIA